MDKPSKILDEVLDVKAIIKCFPRRREESALLKDEVCSMLSAIYHQTFLLYFEAQQ